MVAVPVGPAASVADPEPVAERSHAVGHLHLHALHERSVAHRAACERVFEEIEVELLAQVAELLQWIMTGEQADVGAASGGDTAIESEYEPLFRPGALHEPRIIDRAFPRRVEPRCPQPARETPEVVVAEEAHHGPR